MTSALQTGVIKLQDATQNIRVRMRNPQKVRGVEAWLLVVAWAIAGGAIMLTQLGALGAIDTTVLYLAGGLGVLTLIVHITLRIVAREADPFILPIVTALNGIGIA